jgi:hypothetical protein
MSNDAHLEAFGLKRPLTQQAVYNALRNRGLTLRTHRDTHPPTFEAAWPQSRQNTPPSTLEDAVKRAFDLVLDRSSQKPEEATETPAARVIPEGDFDPLEATPVGSTGIETPATRRNRLRREATARHRAAEAQKLRDEAHDALTTTHQESIEP